MQELGVSCTTAYCTPGTYRNHRIQRVVLYRMMVPVPYRNGPVSGDVYKIIVSDDLIALYDVTAAP